ncbi:MAG: CapA family protein [Lachnospiraceae bacterium]
MRRILISAVIILTTGMVLLLSTIYLEAMDARESEIANVSGVKNSADSDEGTTETTIVEAVTESEVMESEENILSQVPSTEVTNATTTLIFGGDVYLSPYVLDNYDSQGIQGVVSEEILSRLQTADIVMVNQEFPFGTKGEKAPDKQYTFRVDPAYTSLLQDLSVDIVSLANNHVLDYGTVVLEENFAALDEEGILYAGAGSTYERARELITVEKNGTVFGFLAASRVLPVVSWNAENQVPGVFSTYDKTALVESIEQAVTKCDHLTVFVHWGIERETQPQAYQTELAHSYIDAGADLVIGAHPHVLQGIEYYEGKPIFYSLGNFIFNSTIESTMLLEITVDQKGSSSAEILPAKATNATTILMDEQQQNTLNETLQSISFGTVRIEENFVLNDLML